VWNLLSNAVKFTPAGGRVDVFASCTDGVMRLRVSDSGQGIAPDFLPYVFEAFRQANGGTTRRHGGLGLGLAIVRQIVQAHGGTISAFSEGPGKGSTFSLEMPVRNGIDRVSPVDATATDVATDNRLDGVRVLLVDDDEDSLELLIRALSRSGAAATACCSAEEALQKLPRVRPHVVVSDIAMPGMDGYELIRRVRALSPEEGGLTPAIALTAQAARETRENAISAGFQEYDSKPVDVDRLLRSVEALSVKQLSTS
jgi:CheY-like chemotaxis protein